jgi:NitT/TauT family transport system permease protein
VDAISTSKQVGEVQSARPAPAVSEWRRHENALIGTISVLAFLAFWEAVVQFGFVNPLFTSSPSRIATAGYELFASGTIYGDLQASGSEFFAGYGLAIAIGVPLGVLMGWSPRKCCARSVRIRAYATPRIALPLVMIWFVGAVSPITIVFLGAVFPILVNTITGVRTSTPTSSGWRARSGNDRHHSSSPCRLGAAAARRLAARPRSRAEGIVVGEMFGAAQGLGFLIASRARTRPTR